MTVRFPQSDGRGIVARKWSTDYSSGPLILLAERIVKYMIKHGWPCEYLVRVDGPIHPTVVKFVRVGRGETLEWSAFLDDVVRTIAALSRVRYELVNSELSLCGDYYVHIASRRIVAIERPPF